MTVKCFVSFGAVRYGGNVTSENVKRLKFVENSGRKSYQIKSGLKLILKRGSLRGTRKTVGVVTQKSPNRDEHIFYTDLEVFQQIDCNLLIIVRKP